VKLSTWNKLASTQDGQVKTEKHKQWTKTCVSAWLEVWVQERKRGMKHKEWNKLVHIYIGNGSVQEAGKQIDIWLQEYGVDGVASMSIKERVWMYEARVEEERWRAQRPKTRHKKEGKKKRRDESCEGGREKEEFKRSKAQENKKEFWRKYREKLPK
jgi:hypothetical protein